jgi:hypothetical protein
MWKGRPRWPPFLLALLFQSRTGLVTTSAVVLTAVVVTSTAVPTTLPVTEAAVPTTEQADKRHPKTMHGIKIHIRAMIRILILSPAGSPLWRARQSTSLIASQLARRRCFRSTENGFKVRREACGIDG